MAITGLQQDVPLVPQPSETLEAKFRRLTATWRRQTGHLSSMSAAACHPAYHEIISLGPDVITMLLRDLEDNHAHWFIALRQITGADPIPKEAAGNIPKMVQAWTGWAKEHGYQW